MNFDPGKLLEDVKELVIIPDIGDSLFHKVEELKRLKEKDIDYYRKIGLISPKNIPQQLERQSFEIIPGEKQWQPSIEIPRQIIDYMVKSEIEPGLTKMERGVKFPGLPGRYTIVFEKKNSKLITGTIQVEIENPREQWESIVPPGNRLKVLPGDPEHENLREFLFYLMSNELLYQHVMCEFRLRWKPALDSQFFKNKS